MVASAPQVNHRPWAMAATLAAADLFTLFLAVAAGFRACGSARSDTAATSTSRHADRASGSAARAAGCAAGERRSARAGADAIIAAADQL